MRGYLVVCWFLVVAVREQWKSLRYVGGLRVLVDCLVGGGGGMGLGVGSEVVGGVKLDVGDWADVVPCDGKVGLPGC